MSTITVYETNEFVKICALLVQEGVIFNATRVGNCWVISFTGGF